MTFHNSEKKSQNVGMLSQLLDKNTEIYNIKCQNYDDKIPDYYKSQPSPS